MDNENDLVLYLLYFLYEFMIFESDESNRICFRWIAVLDVGSENIGFYPVIRFNAFCTFADIETIKYI